MNNKILVSVIIPILEETYEVFIPVGKRINTAISLIRKTVNELSDDNIPEQVKFNLYNSETGEVYNKNLTIKEANIKNGMEIILL